jgi:hypothetical protein
MRVSTLPEAIPTDARSHPPSTGAGTVHQRRTKATCATGCRRCWRWSKACFFSMSKHNLAGVDFATHAGSLCGRTARTCPQMSLLGQQAPRRAEPNNHIKY